MEVWLHGVCYYDLPIVIYVLLRIVFVVFIGTIPRLVIALYFILKYFDSVVKMFDYNLL